MEVMQAARNELDIAAKQANRLIESIYKMDVNEHKLLLLATRKVNELELKNEPFSERTRIVITAAEFAQQYGISRPSAFEIIVAAKNTIYEREFVYLHVEDNGEVVPMRSRWLQARQEDKAKSEISFLFASAVIPLIYLVETEYTMLDLHEVGKLKSKYAVRLYKYLMRWLNAPYKNKIPLEKLREVFGLDDDEYPAMRDFKKRVLDISVKQVAAGTAFKDLTYSVRKEGTKITHVDFHYSGYTNKNIKNQKAVIEGEANAKKEKEFVIYQMTDSQIKTFAKTISQKATNSETNKAPEFHNIGQMVEPGQGSDVLEGKIIDDFVDGNFEPYYEALQALNFKPTVFNRTKPTNAVKDAQKGENSEDEAKMVGYKGKQEKAPESAGESQTEVSEDEGEGLNDESTVVYTEFSDSDIENYNLYVNKTNGKRTLNEILTMCNEMGKPPGLVIGMLIQKKIR